MSTAIRLPEPLGASVHAKEIRAFFGGNLIGPNELPEEIRFAFLCFTNRSGSNYLAELLASTGQLNIATEAMDWEEVARVAGNQHLASFQEYLARVMKHNARSGWFLTKLAIAYLPLLREAGLLDRCFAGARFIHITRADALGQAISYEIACQNRRWASFLPSAKPDEALEFSAERIAEHVARFAAGNRQFEELFAANGIVPLRITYEELLQDPQSALDRLAPSLGFNTLTVDATKLRLARQAGAINKRWRELFLAAKADAGRI